MLSDIAVMECRQRAGGVAPLHHKRCHDLCDPLKSHVSSPHVSSNPARVRSADACVFIPPKSTAYEPDGDAVKVEKARGDGPGKVGSHFLCGDIIVSAGNIHVSSSSLWEKSWPPIRIKVRD